ncbi:hypothetical protein ACFYYS_17940 [Streptomyces sp. NPDC002120]|uniref:hypothetical protein n=1 Tax=Streptomyces sp. NPDC002120 TaxID=3364631 RepID=UPI00368F1CD5
MDHVIRESDAKSEPTVRRSNDRSEAFTAVHQAEIDHLVEARWKAQAEANARVFAAEQRAQAPILRMMEQDADAASAFRELAHLEREARVAQRDDLILATTHFRDAQARDALRSVKQGANIFVPPYDWQITDPVFKAGGSTADKDAGWFDSFAGWDGDHSGASWATAGVGVALKASIDGVARIAPAMFDTWNWEIFASLFSAYTNGVCKVVVQDPVSGAVLGPQGERTIELWHRKSQTSADGHGSDSFFASDIAPTVTLAAGQVFNVSFLASIFTDQSGDLAFGYSRAGCYLHVSLPLFTVHMNDNY